MTERLFDLDSYITEFDCRVISLTAEKNRLLVETDRTAFFPEGGGQTSDRGYLGEVCISDVQIKEGRIFHYAENTPENVAGLKEGTFLKGKIDWKKRFSDMQQHSAEHIFSGIVHSLYGFENIGFHLGTEVVTLDFDGVLGGEEIYKVEYLVNEVIWKNIPSKVYLPTQEELANITYRSKKEIDGQIRIVEFEGVDVCACCAPHVKMTGEIGVMEVVAFEKYKGGTRISILCGDRAMKDMRHKLTENHKVSVLTSSKEKETSEAVERIKKEKESLDYEIVGLKREILSLKLASINEEKRIVVFDSSLQGKMLMDFAQALSKKCDEFVCCLCGDKGEYRYCIISESVDPSVVCKKLNSAFSGKGGGRGTVAQGSLKGQEREIREFLLNAEV